MLENSRSCFKQGTTSRTVETRCPAIATSKLKQAHECSMLAVPPFLETTVPHAMAVSGKARALSRPTSASTRPPSAGSVREGSPGLSSQRPTSAGSTSASLSRPSNASLYRPTSAGSAVQGSEVSSRPVSAKSQAGPVNPSTCRASLETEESVNNGHAARGDSPSRGGRLLGPHSQDNAITQSSDFSRRAVEEELQQPVLTPIPNSIATPLERQMGTAIGLKGRNRLVPRLPRDVVHCLHGQNCCWRWLARAAMEEIHCGSLASVSLADGVTMMKEDCYQGEAVGKRPVI